MGWEWARGREGLSAKHCRDDFVTTSAGVGGGRESVLDKGPQGPLRWEAGGKGGEASLREGLHSFSGGLPIPAFRPVTVGADAGSWVLVSLCGVVGVLVPIRAAPKPR